MVTALALLAVVLAGASALGLTPYRALVVRSGSMSPALETGDLVLAGSIRGADVQRGQVVTFHDPTRASLLVTHRVVAVHDRPDHREVVTRGDANTGTERWTVTAQDRVEVVIGRVPRAGYLTGWLAAPAVKATLLSVLAALAGGAAIRRIWR